MLYIGYMQQHSWLNISDSAVFQRISTNLISILLERSFLAASVIQTHRVDDALVQRGTRFLWPVYGWIVEEQNAPKESSKKATKTKRAITCMFAQALLGHFSSKNPSKTCQRPGLWRGTLTWRGWHPHPPASSGISEKRGMERSVCMVTRHRRLHTFVASCLVRSSQQSDSPEVHNWKRSKVQNTWCDGACPYPWMSEMSRSHWTSQFHRYGLGREIRGHQ